MVGQLDRLVSLAGLPNVEIAVLRFDAPSPVLPLEGFAINDARVVWVETLTGEQRIDARRLQDDCGLASGWARSAERTAGSYARYPAEPTDDLRRRCA
jgi:hypothetical protein